MHFLRFVRFKTISHKLKMYINDSFGAEKRSTNLLRAIGKPRREEKFPALRRRSDGSAPAGGHQMEPPQKKEYELKKYEYSATLTAMV